MKCLDDKSIILQILDCTFKYFMVWVCTVYIVHILIKNICIKET